MPPSDGTPQKQPWFYSLLSKIPGLKRSSESEMGRFRQVEVFANRYRDSRVVSDAIMSLGFTLRDFELEVWPTYWPSHWPPTWCLLVLTSVGGVDPSRLYQCSDNSQAHAGKFYLAKPGKLHRFPCVTIIMTSPSAG